MNRNSLFFILFLLPCIAQAQYWEGGIQLGFSNYIGDLSNNSRKVFLGETNPAGGIFLRYNLHQYLSLKAEGNFMSISGSDSNSNQVAIRERNLSFTSRIIELGLHAEWNILGYEPYGLSQPFSPYLFAGVAGVRFNPKATINDQTYNLQPLGTEGQGMSSYPDRSPYSLTQLVIPMGFGFKYAQNDNWNLGISLGYRLAFTDYLDDVSASYVPYSELLAGNGAIAAQLGNRTGELTDSGPVITLPGTPRGDNAARDGYFFLGLSISKNFLDNGLMGSRKRGKRKAGCYN